MMASTALSGLKRQRPEWEPWLAVIEEIVRETGSGSWDSWVPPDLPVQPAPVPRLAGAAVSVPAPAVRRLLERLIRLASRSESPAMATLPSVLDADLDVLTIFAASLCHDADRLKEIAARAGADTEALHAVAALLPVPLLHACNRRWASSIPESWVEGYCPVCASWPAFSEVRGIERNRYCRCGRCGAEWRADILHCPYCATRDHDELVALVPEKSGPKGAVDACRRCRGYLKTFNRLQGCPAETVVLEDLASVDLDVAALERGYARPPGAGYALNVGVMDGAAPRRFFAWKR
jgi:FdhE protein